MRKLAWVGVAVLAIGCAVFVWSTFAGWFEDAARPRANEPSAVAPAAIVHDAPDAELAAPSLSPSEDARVALDAPTTNGASDAARGALNVRVVADDDARPLAGVRLALRPSPKGPYQTKNVATSHGDETRAPLSDAYGRASFDVAAGRAFVLVATRDDALALRAERDVAALAPNEVRFVNIELPTAPNCTRYGRVVDADTREPIVGARVAARAGGKLASNGPNVRSDAAGLFAWPAHTSSESVLQVEADGYGPRIAWLDARFDRPERALEIELSRGAALVLRVSGEATTNEPLQVEVTSSLGDAIQPDPSPAPSTFHSIRSDERQARPVELGSTVTFEPLPARTTLEVVVRAGTTKLARRKLGLKPGERRELELVVGGTNTIVGTLREQGGAPIAGQGVLLLRKREPWSTTPRAATSGPEGRFEFGDVEPDTWTLVVDPHSPPEGEPGWLGEPITVVVGPHDRIVEVELVAERGLSIAGIVVDEAGQPVANATVFAGESVGTLLASYVNVATGEDGQFLCAPVSAREWQVWATCGEPPAASLPVIANGGSSGIRLVLEKPRTSAVVVLDEHGAPAARGNLTYSRVDPPSTAVWSRGFELGEAELELAPGTWNLVALTSDGRIAARRVQVAGDERDERFTLTLEPGATLVLHTTHDLAPFTVTHEGAQIESDSVVTGSARRVIVPPGRSRIAWTSAKSGAPITREVSLAPEESVEIALDED